MKIQRKAKPSPRIVIPKRDPNLSQGLGKGQNGNYVGELEFIAVLLSQSKVIRERYKYGWAKNNSKALCGSKFKKYLTKSSSCLGG